MLCLLPRALLDAFRKSYKALLKPRPSPCPRELAVFRSRCKGGSILSRYRIGLVSHLRCWCVRPLRLASHDGGSSLHRLEPTGGSIVFPPPRSGRARACGAFRSGRRGARGLCDIPWFRAAAPVRPLVRIGRLWRHKAGAQHGLVHGPILVPLLSGWAPRHGSTSMTARASCSSSALSSALRAIAARLCDALSSSVRIFPSAIAI